MGLSYLKKYYLNDEKLAQRARLEFFRALDTGRMIAFTGAMATQARGYGGWQQLRMAFADAAAKITCEQISDQRKRKKLLDEIKKFEEWGAKGKCSPTVTMNLIEELLDQNEDQLGPIGSSSDWPLDHAESAHAAMRVELAKGFRAPNESWQIDRDALGAASTSFKTEFDVPNALWAELGIRRFATPSYDFEIERTIMLSDGDGDHAEPSPFKRLKALRKARDENFSWDLGSGRIRRVFSDGWALESDLINRERIDRMIEFAVGTDDVDGHVMHLHGRACTWRSMVVTQRDYDDLYRRDSLNRAPFEYARRMMMGGNPILFVGLGMTEAELNREMQEFVSNSPYQRGAPIFLLWSARPDNLKKPEIAAKRADLLRRLGVLTLFDTDFGVGLKDDLELQTYANKGAVRERYQNTEEAYSRVNLGLADDFVQVQLDIADKHTRADLQDLKTCVDQLVQARNLQIGDDLSTFKNPALRERVIGKNWRSMKGRIDAKDNNNPIVLWKRNSDSSRNSPGIKELVRVSKANRVVCVIGAQGCGKGSASSQLAQTAKQAFGLDSSAHCLLINGGFSFDTDTLLDGIARFFLKRFGRDEELKEHSRPRAFEKLEISKARFLKDASVVVVINGMERFFDVAGQPLSAELDELLNLAVASHLPKGLKPKVRWALFGTERVRNHFTRIGAEVVDYSEVVEPQPPRQMDIPGCYLNQVWQRWNEACQAQTNQPAVMPPALQHAVARYRANASGRISGDSIELRRELFASLFDDFHFGQFVSHFKNDKNSNIKLARAVLRALAFIGLPVEADILALMPGIVNNGNWQDELDALVAAQLVFKMDGYADGAEDSTPEDRYTLHRSLLTELRYRFGIPLSEAKLSTAFNMSLYVAQPIDGDIPDTDMHDDLGNAIDKLIKSYRDFPRKDGISARARLPGVNEKTLKEALCAAARHCGDSGCANGMREDADYAAIDALCDGRYARALRTALALVRSYYSTTGLLTLDSGDRLIRDGRDGVLMEHAERLDDLIDAYGKATLAREKLREELEESFDRAYGTTEPFYPDELVWLHNERGVVRLAMGDLYEARKSFDFALRVNSERVEFRDRAHNWRRIRLNQLTVDFEMGDIGTAERKCEEIIAICEKRSPCLREDKLAKAIAKGYKAWALHLRGKHVFALDLYEEADTGFAELGEVRAQAYFGRLWASCLLNVGDEEGRRRVLEQALDLAQSAVQMDIVHRIQIALAQTYILGPQPAAGALQQRAHRYLDEALVYALNANVHRVRCEASMVTANVRYAMSDFEGALRFATDAMMIATRQGLELRKISLRALIAKIMAARGHPVTAEQLARTCIKMATRQKFQAAIDQASNVILGIPRISSAISSSDLSGRRNF